MARQYTNHDAEILAFVERCLADPDAYDALTFRLIGRVVGISEAGAYNRLVLMRERGLVTWKAGKLATLRVLSRDLSKLRSAKLIGRPRKPSGQCTYRGCGEPRYGSQWCARHEALFRQYHGKPMEA